MNIGIAGLGLMGGSFAKAVKERTEHRVYGCDTDRSTFLAAKMFGVLDGELSADTLPECDIIIIATWPKRTVEYLRENARHIRKDCVVMDCGGTKEMVCEQVYPIMKEYGFWFVGAHPMAGTAAFGFESSKETMFVKAPMILTPYTGAPIATVAKISAFCQEIGFTRTPVLTPEEHDKMIAYTSQLAHVVSSAYIQNPLAMRHKGYSSGSFRDLTRVAKLNVPMWTELFIENSENLSSEVDALANKLHEYAKAIREKDENALSELLSAGVSAKLESEEKEKEKEK